MIIKIYGNVMKVLSIALSQDVSVQGDVSRDGRSATIETDDSDDLIDIIEASGCSWEQEEEPELFQSKRLNAPRLRATDSSRQTPKMSWCKSKAKQKWQNRQ